MAGAQSSQPSRLPPRRRLAARGGQELEPGTPVWTGVSQPLTEHLLPRVPFTSPRVPAPLLSARCFSEPHLAASQPVSARVRLIGIQVGVRWLSLTWMLNPICLHFYSKSFYLQAYVFHVVFPTIVFKQRLLYFRIVGYIYLNTIQKPSENHRP